jgi:hypothetical protein
MTYELLTTVGTILLVVWLVWRFSHPFTCTCGYRSWFIGGFRRHLLKGHKWSEH